MQGIELKCNAALFGSYLEQNTYIEIINFVDNFWWPLLAPVRNLDMQEAAKDCLTA